MPDLTDFLGDWRLSRVIEDARAGQVLRLDGHVRFERDGEGLVYRETGILRVPGQAPMEATRRYLWRQGPDGIAVHFDDGRFFHSIAQGDRPTAHHLCPPDDYRVAYDFSAWPRWTCQWRVSGPRKEYTMRSAYDRAPLGACAGHGAGAEEASTT